MTRKPGLSGALFLLAVLVWLVPAVASAQVQKGSLFVKIVDEQGGALPGATLELTSPVMPGAMNSVSDKDGQFRFTSLTNGTYKLKVSLQGMTTLVRENLVVTQDQTTEFTATMKVGSVNESVTVQAESPVVDTKDATLQVNIDSHILQGTPGGRDIWSTIEFKAPGVTIDTGGGSPPDVGGNQGGLQRSLTSRGVPNGQNTQMLNGTNVNDPAAQGFSMNYYVPTALDNIQVSTAAEDISIGTAGVFINMVTKSGTNTFGGMALADCEGTNCGGINTSSSNINATQIAQGIRANSNQSSLIANTNFQIGGPIIHNRLFFFESTNFQAIHAGVTNFPAVAPANLPTQLSGTSNEDTTDTIAGEGHVNFQLNAKNRFEGYLSKQRYDKPNRASSAGNTQDSDFKELDTFVIMQAGWNYVISDRQVLDTRLSYNNTHFDLLQKTNLQPIADTATGNQYWNNTSQPLMFRRRTEILSNWQYFLPDFLKGRNEFRVGFDNGYTPETVTTDRVGNVNLNITSTANPEQQTVRLFNTPTIVNRAVNYTAYYGQDTYSINRFTAVMGVRWERVEGYLPPQTTTSNSEFFPAGTVFNNVTINGVPQSYTVQSQYAAVRHDPLWHNWAPRFSLTYDLTGHGTSALKFSAGKYLDQISTGTPPNPNGTISQTYLWNDLNNDFQFQPGNVTWNGSQYVGGPGSELGALVPGSTNIPNPVGFFNQAEQRPYTLEQTAEYDQELIPGLAATIAYVHTEQRHQLATVDQSQALWFAPGNPIYQQITITDPGRDGVIGTADDQQLTVFEPVSAANVVSSITTNSDVVDQHTHSVSFNVNKRFSHGWALVGGYTYAHVFQQAPSVSNPNGEFVNSSGVSGGRAHDFKLSGTFELPYQILFGVNGRLDSGLPVTRTFTISTCSKNITTNCLTQGATVNAEPRGSVLLPWLGTADIRFGRFFTMGTNRFDVSIDIYNITNANTVFSVRTNTGLTTVFPNNDPTQPATKIPSFLSPTGITGPRMLRFNVTYSFGTR